MKIPRDIKRLKVYGWVALAFLFMTYLPDAGQNPNQLGSRFINTVWKTLYWTFINYTLFEYFYPRMGWRKFFRSALVVIFYIFLYSALAFVWRQIGIGLHIYTDLDPAAKSKTIMANLASHGFGSLFFYGIILLIYNHGQLKQAAQQLKIEKQQTELNYLKSQTNPHFLFNTLNNIYSLARDKSEQAPETILRLSKILRFMIYEAGGQYIAIEEELKIIGDYISLEKLRYDETLRINFNYDVEDMKQALPPLLLIPLVENAFKHGASETRSRPFVDIHLSVARRQLVFIVKNSTDGGPVNEKPKENIGLSNLRRQLQLQYTDYSVSIEQKESEFSAALKINLASHV